jgi:hypothetical protein
LANARSNGSLAASRDFPCLALAAQVRIDGAAHFCSGGPLVVLGESA